MKELIYCTNTECGKKHCLCHSDNKHWAEINKRATLDGIIIRKEYNDGITPCKGYISRIKRNKYNIKLNQL